MFSVSHDLFWPDLPKSLAKISKRPENQEKKLMFFGEWRGKLEREIQIRKIIWIVCLNASPVRWRPFNSILILINEDHKA